MQSTTKRTIKQQFYDSTRWRKLRLIILRASPLCVRCHSIGLLVPAAVVDHCIGFSDKHDTLATDEDNLFPLCASCHNQITQYEKNGRYKDLSLEDTKRLKYTIREINSDGYVTTPPPIALI